MKVNLLKHRASFANYFIVSFAKKLAEISSVPAFGETINLRFWGISSILILRKMSVSLNHLAELAITPVLTDSMLAAFKEDNFLADRYYLVQQRKYQFTRELDKYFPLVCHKRVARLLDAEFLESSLPLRN